MHAMGTGTPVAFHAPEVIQNGIVDVMNGMNDIGTNTLLLYAFGALRSSRVKGHLFD